MEIATAGTSRLAALLATALFGASACTTSSTGSGEGHGEEEHEEEEPGNHDHAAGAVRALISDEQGVLRLYDLDDGGVIFSHTFSDIDGSGLTALNTTEDGRFGIINMRGSANRVAFLDSGVLVEGHGDHVHLEVEQPELLDYHIQGDEFGASRIAHVASRDERISAFFDGEAELTDSAYAITIPLSNLMSGAPTPAEVHVGNRHHGVAVPAEDGALIMSVAESGAIGSTARTGVRVYQGATELAAFAMSCDGLHGYAVVGEHYLFGCGNAQGGVLVVTHEDASDTWGERQIDYPDGATNGISNFAAHPALSFALAPWGSEAFMRVDPDSEQMSEEAVLELPAQQCGYTLRQDNGAHLLVLTTDGVLRSYEAADWSEGPVLQVLDEFECSGAVPLLRAVGSFVYVMDVQSNVLSEIIIDDTELVLERSIGLEGESRRMTLFHHPVGLEDHDH